jgi:RNA polymerase sigma factor (sigma-70 family)
MEHPATNPVMDYLRAVAVCEEATPDAVLLRRYVQHRDADAFGLIVRRHGPMVLGVCRRLLGPTLDADDAFQATFVALTRQAASVRECLGGWLHRVAVRAARRALRRPPVAPLPSEVVDPTDPFANTEWRDLRSLLDAELTQLPAKLHAPLVLCYLDGLTRDEAAQRLGWSLRTLHRRLDEGRQRLRQRLTRRGLAPLVLGTLVGVTDGLRAVVPPALVRRTRLDPVAPAVQQLVPPFAWRGGIMKMVTCALVIGVGILGLGMVSPADADPPLAPESPVVRAPKLPQRDPFLDEVAKSKTAVVAFLRKQQNTDGSWEDQKGPLASGISSGGTSCLVLLALLEAGLTAEDDTIKQGLKYVRSVPPTGTYVVALQTQALCKANQKEDAKRIAANVAWLEKAVARERGTMTGWSYTDKPGRGDGSNSRYAIVALHAAHKVGFKVQGKDFWTDVAGMYLTTQNANGGWGYVSPQQPTATMTGSGVIGVQLAYDVIGAPTKESKAATENGCIWYEDRFTLKQTYDYYHLDVLANMGRATERRKLTDRAKSFDWYREGCAWLFKQQKESGQFQGSNAETPCVASAFALRFLASGE